jgi:hypothetical protein
VILQTSVILLVWPVQRAKMNGCLMPKGARLWSETRDWHVADRDKTQRMHMVFEVFTAWNQIKAGLSRFGTVCVAFLQHPLEKPLFCPLRGMVAVEQWASIRMVHLCGGGIPVVRSLYCLCDHIQKGMVLRDGVDGEKGIGRVGPTRQTPRPRWVSKLFGGHNEAR